MRVFWIAILLFIIYSPAAFAQDSYVLLVSFDGFRYDYVDKYDLPTFKEIQRNGASSERMIPSFPSKTFPNHYTLVTGLYPGSHGLIDNKFYDPELNIKYTNADLDAVTNPAFYGGWPLWQWVQENGLKSGSFFWVGSETKIHGRYPDYWKKYNHHFPNDARIDTVFSWFAKPKEDRPQFISMYFSIIDDAGHSFGPENNAVAEALKEADNLVARIRREIEASGLPINLVIVSDHGMYEISAGKNSSIELGTYIDIPEGALQISNNGSHMHIYMNDPAFAPEFYAALNKNTAPFNIYKREKLPKHWEYGTSPRIGDFLVIAEPGFYFSKIKHDLNFGVHGYDPYVTRDMDAIFYAEGPDIKQGVHLNEFRNVDVYSFICALLGIKPAKNDGGLTILGEALLKEN